LRWSRAERFSPEDHSWTDGNPARLFLQKSLLARRAIFSADCREPADRRPVRQQVIATLGRLEELQASGQLQRLLRSGARFAAHALVLERCESNHRHGELDGGYRAA